MTDPLDALRAPRTPVDPDPDFARSLRARLERALLDLPLLDLPLPDLPEEPMTLTDIRPQSLTPRLTMIDARAAAEFCVAAFGATRRGEATVLPDGSVANIEIAIGGRVLMLTEEYPEGNLVAPVTRGGASQSLRLEVDDPDAALAHALAAGAVLDSPVTDASYGRSGAVLDPSGHRWVLAREVPTARPGDIVYASLWTPDADRALRFHGAVLGWESVTPPGVEVHLANGMGLSGGHRHGGLFLCYAVDDVDAAAAVVRAAGGTASEPTDRDYGRLADCVDDQGLAFALFQGPGAPITVPEYAELRLPDATRARAFYGTVLGWGFSPGHHGTGYWNGTVAGERTRPRTGLHGGYEAPTVVAAFAVPDLAAATAAARAAGGTTEDPITARFGLVARCADDQGTPFVLLQA